MSDTGSTVPRRQVGRSRGKFTSAQKVRCKIGGLRPRYAAWRLRGHRLLDLVDKVGQRTSTPCRQETASCQGWSDHTFERLAVTGYALRLVELLATRGLGVRVHTVCDGARLSSQTDQEDHADEGTEACQAGSATEESHVHQVADYSLREVVVLGSI